MHGITQITVQYKQTGSTQGDFHRPRGHLIRYSHRQPICALTLS